MKTEHPLQSDKGICFILKNPLKVQVESRRNGDKIQTTFAKKLH